MFNKEVNSVFSVNCSINSTCGDNTLDMLQSKVVIEIIEIR